MYLHARTFMATFALALLVVYALTPPKRVVVKFDRETENYLSSVRI